MHATLCDLIVDLVQNAFEADAPETSLVIKENASQTNIEIRDNGKGMDAATLKRATDPFYTDGKKHKHRKVGLGLPFLFQTAEMTGGKASIESNIGEGTVVSLELDNGHIDLPEKGNIATALLSLMTYQKRGNLIVTRTKNGNSYTISKNELVEVLGELDDIESLQLLKQFLSENEEELDQ